MKLLHLLLCLVCGYSYSCLHAQSKASIDTSRQLPIGGIKQYITLKGKDRSKPLLLYLHGGPGGSVMSYADKFTAKLQENFVVVQWDQRETGKTKQLNDSPEPLTLKLMVQDTHDLILHLLTQFHQPKIYLAGHSWGTVLGFQIAGQYPQLIQEYVAISPVVNQLESERVSLERLKAQAAATKNTVAQDELSRVKIPFENAEMIYYHRKWLFHFNGQKVRSFTKEYALSWASTWLTLWNEASALNLSESLPEINCPVYFFTGRKDYQTNSKITEAYYNKLLAPKKEIVWFDRSGHSIPTTEPEKMQEIIIERSGMGVKVAVSLPD
jgi:pimeloyl-ACP methyl ester carboxylesterase